MSHSSAPSTRVACVYTALIGGYEKLNEQPAAATSRIPFICLTDDPDLRSETWQVRQVEPMFPLDPIRSHRQVKLCPHVHLPDFDCSIYIDNSVLLKVPAERLIEQHLAASPFCLPEHSFRDSVLDEFLEVEALGFDDPTRLFEQLNHYALELPEVLKEKPYWTGILIRDHKSAKVRKMLDIWLAHVQRYSRRDQLSANIAFKRAGLTPQILRIDSRESWFHSWPKGTASRPANFKRLASPFLSYPAARIEELSRNSAKERLEREKIGASAAELEAALADERLQRAALEGSAADLTGAIEAMRRRLRAMQKKNRALKSSTSWRITAPLRKVITTLRSSKRAPAPKCATGNNSLAKAEVVEPVQPAQKANIPAATENHTVAAFSRDGFIGPIDLFTQAQCDLILKHYRLGTSPAPNPKWFKDLAARDRFFYELARSPALVALLRPLLREDIVLWGATVVERAPDQRHIWHTDIETSGPDGRFASVWVGLEETCRASALQLVSRSHRFGRPIQQEVYERGLKRGEATDQMVTSFAQEQDPHSDFVQPDMRDGQALVFDGRLWHGSHNAGDRSRAALLLQYAAAGTRVLIPEFNHTEWPFRFTSAEAPCVMVAGSSDSDNVRPPPSACPPDAAPLCSQVLPGSGFHESSDGWIPYHLFQGPTPLLTEMESHVSVLSPGHSPHSPHCHVQEEILIVLSGEAEILIGEGPDPGGARVECLGPGSFVYYPAYQYHTIRNTSGAPVTYLMYKWQAGPAEVNEPMRTKVFDIGGLSPAPSSQPMSMPVLFEAPTGYLDKLHAHVTDLQIGASYPAHADEHDVAIVVFTGTVETLGKTVGPGGTIFYAAGEPHGMRNVGDEPARYLVFEFHRSPLVEVPN